jgi:hypothetical protein
VRRLGEGLNTKLTKEERTRSGFNHPPIAGELPRAKRAFVFFVSFSSFVLNVFGLSWVPAFAGMNGIWDQLNARPRIPTWGAGVLPCSIQT